MKLSSLKFGLSFAVLMFAGVYKTPGVSRKSGINTVVIDAGHGGHDPGCHYGKFQEKNITLAIALKLGRMIKANYKDVRVIYTRNDDTFVPLIDRAGIANKAKADLFISIHVNANHKPGVFGTETYTMGPHKTNDNLEVAKRENEVVLLEADYKENYEGYDPKSPEADIIFSLYQDAYMVQSLSLARFVEHEMQGTVKRTSRGVKQAGFVVLWKTAMPSVLIETGFLSNAKEREFLAGEAGQNSLAKGIYNAFAKYKAKIEG